MCKDCSKFKIGSENYIKRTLEETLLEIPKHFTNEQGVKIDIVPAYSNMKCKGCGTIYGFQYERK